MADHDCFAEMAKEMIDEEGRAVKLIRFNQTPTDANKEWRGNSTPLVSPDGELDLIGLFIHPDSLSQYGDKTLSKQLLKTAELLCLIGPGVGFTEDLRSFTVLEDGTGANLKRYKIVFVESLKPGPIDLLYYIGLSHWEGRSV